MSMRKIPFMVGGLVFVLAAALGGRQTVPQTPTRPRPLPRPVKLLPDVEVKGARFSLISTELGKPGVEFPRDTVRFTATLKNAGLAPCPEGGSFHIQLTRNGVAIANSTASDLLGAVGSTYSYSWVDTIVHGQAKELSYTITVSPAFLELTGNNNSASCMGYEGMLHGFGGADLGITNLTSSFVDGPAGRTFYFVVTVRNNSLVYPSISATAFIYINKDGGQHVAMLDTGQGGLGLPDPLVSKSYTLSRKASELPAGNFWARAVLEIQRDYDPVGSNNVSPGRVLVRNTP